jgi:hypothetical protein
LFLGGQFLTQTSGKFKPQFSHTVGLASYWINSPQIRSRDFSASYVAEISREQIAGSGNVEIKQNLTKTTAGEQTSLRIACK